MNLYIDLPLTETTFTFDEPYLKQTKKKRIQLALNSRVGNRDKLFTWSQLSLSALLLYWLADQSEASSKNCAILIGLD